jgi:hypothetical protein
LRKRIKKIKRVGSTFGGGSIGPPRMEAWRENLEGYAKWRHV